MPFISENRLEETLVKAITSPQMAAEFYRLLLESDLLVMGSAMGHESAAANFSLEPGSQLKLIPGERNGEKFLPVFSSLPRMQAYVKEESRYLAIKGRDLLEMTRGAPVILNPGSEYGKELTADEVAQLLDGGRARPRTIIGEAVFPPGLVETLTSVFEKQPQVCAAWMIQVTFADRDAPHPLVGIEIDSKGGSDMPALMAEIERAAQAGVPGMVFDVQRVDRGQPAGMAEALLQTIPFYERALRN